MDDSSRRFGWPKRSAEASGIASVAIAGNNLAPISTNVFMGDWFPLLQAYLDPSSLDPQLHPERFVGREWLFKEIDEFISTNQSGYFVIEADAGLGKTAFALQLTKRGKHASHFSCIDWRARNADSAIRNISAQLIAAWNLTDLAPQGMLPPGADRPAWLWHVLSTVAKHRDRTDPTRPLVLVIDGLDEAEPHHAGTMPFGLPSNLPPGVFVVATTRTGTPLPALRQPYRIRLLKASSAVNEWDMGRYLATQILESGLAERIDEERADPNIFTQQLLGRCSGVWIYLHCVLTEIRHGLRHLNEIGNLPTDLEGYYGQNLAALSENEEWLTWYLPLLATLGVAAEPLDCNQIAKFAGIENVDRIRRFLFTRFRPFCSVIIDAEGEEKFHLYHRSLVEYLSGSTDGSALTGNQGLKNELKRATRDAHKRTCRYFFNIWGELPEHFPALKEDLALAELEKGYGTRHLIGHLSVTGRTEDVETLISARRQTRNSWYEAHDYIGDWDGYLRDVQLARRIAESKTDAAYRDGVSAPTLGTECRYALVSSSITSQVTRIPLPLLEALVSTETWPVSRSLDHIHRINDRASRAAAYICILRHLTGTQRYLAWREALAASTGIDDVEIRAKTLLSLVPLVPRQQQGAVLERAYETGVIKPWEYHVETLVTFSNNINESLIDAAFTTVRQVRGEEALARCLIALAPRLTESLIPEAFAMMERLTNEESRAQFLVSLTAGSAINSFADQALDVARQFREPSARAQALAAVAKLLAEELAAEAISDALLAARAITERPTRAIMLAQIASRLGKSELRNEVVREALSIVESVNDLAARVGAVARICSEIGETECRPTVLATLDMVRASDDAELVVLSFAVLAPYLPHDEGAIALRHALKLVTPILDRTGRDEALAAIAEEWPTHALPEAVSFSSRVDDDFSRTEFLSRLVPRLEHDLLGKIVTTTEAIASPGCRVRLARTLAPYVPDQLVARVFGLLIGVDGGEGSRRADIPRAVLADFRHDSFFMHSDITSTVRQLTKGLTDRHRLMEVQRQMLMERRRRGALPSGTSF